MLHWLPGQGDSFVCLVPVIYVWLSLKKYVFKKCSEAGNSTSLDKGSQCLYKTAEKKNLCIVGYAWTFALLLEQYLSILFVDFEWRFSI